MAQQPTFVNPTLADSSGGPANINTSIDAFQAQNLSPSDIASLSNSIPQTLGGIPGLGSRIPSLAKIPTPFSKLPGILSPITSAKFGVAGTWEAVHYADDLNRHYGKLKFLFKVGFYGFPGGNGSYEFFVHRMDKPRVKFNHVDVNYYNFRTRVLTSTTYEPLTVQFLDDITNSVMWFFKDYLEATSGTGQGNYGIDMGWGQASSSLPYASAYSHNKGQRIVLEQIFVNPEVGPESNRFTFINPRIEGFDFEDVTHEESAQGMANIIFSYDAIYVEPSNTKQTLHSWGTSDLFEAGGTSGPGLKSQSTDPANMYADSAPPGKRPAPSLYATLQKGSDMISNIPNALGGLMQSGLDLVTGSAAGQSVSSAGDTLSKNISDTLDSIQSGVNAKTGGKQ